MPYLLALFVRTLRRRMHLGWIVWFTLICVLLCGLVLSLGGVQLLRTDRYFFQSEISQVDGTKCQTQSDAAISVAAPREVTTAEARAGYQREMFRQLSALLIDRWVGLEGVLAIVSHPSRDMSLFVSSLREDPRAGSESIYQKIAKTKYKRSETFTFLTVPGVVGLLALSGSLLVVLVGTLSIGVLVLGTEVIAERWFGNDFLLSIVGASMAYVVCQMNFPYLTAIYFGELWVGFLVLNLLQRFKFRAGPVLSTKHPAR
jgi:TRAP-type C4-dicarboxylate transport system permease small subunit